MRRLCARAPGAAGISLRAEQVVGANPVWEPGLVSRLSVLICADVAVGVWLAYWLSETKLQEPYECDVLCEGAGIVAVALLLVLLYATLRTARAS